MIRFGRFGQKVVCVCVGTIMAVVQICEGGRIMCIGGGGGL